MKKRFLIKKMGYKKEDLENMNIADIIALGKMGYTKEEITELQKNESNTDLQSEVDFLKNKIEEMEKNNQVTNVHNTVIEEPNNDNLIDKTLEGMVLN